MHDRQNCSHCNYRLFGKIDMKSHMKYVHEIVITSKWNNCKDKSKQEERQCRHVKDNHARIQVACVDCNIRDSPSDPLGPHDADHIPNNFECVQCNTKFKNRDILSFHMKLKHWSELNHCVNRGKYSKDIHSVEGHETTVHDSQPIAGANAGNVQGQEILQKDTYSTIRSQGSWK